jgi:hypothetical protein
MKQFTIFIENKIGELAKLSEAIGRSGVNIKTIVSESSNANPFIKLVTSDIKTTEKALKGKGFVYEIREVLSVEMIDRPGELAKIAKILARKRINVESLYIIGHKNGMTEVALVVDDIKKARAVLELK